MENSCHPRNGEEGSGTNVLNPFQDKLGIPQPGSQEGKNAERPHGRETFQAKA